jgi:hypothetical protein
MIKDIFDGLDRFASKIIEYKHEQRQLADNALRSISFALDETYLYYAELESGQPRNDERERQLSKYWSAAAIPMRHLDKELAEKCDLKSEYWINPDNWSDIKIEEVGISLGKVRGHYRKLLKK